ncbi:DUF6173 family protein [Yoonia sp. 208BN28-4]|uniref:DUF6173 family protein n=1 Tax=Yoonia sp. 208BN28-4 TaxID=3126505 RepID=UPI0030B0C95F
MIENNQIDTSAELAENAVLPGICEVHTDPQAQAADKAPLPPALKEASAGKSPAQWAYERIILYIQNFEKQLDNDHEVGLGFTGGDAGVIKIEGLGYYDPDIVTFYGVNGAGMKTQLIQHVSQMNVMLTASPKQMDQDAPTRIGFKLGEALERDTPAASQTGDTPV